MNLRFYNDMYQFQEILMEMENVSRGIVFNQRYSNPFRDIFTLGEQVYDRRVSYVNARNVKLYYIACYYIIIPTPK